jgi:hypothetical protein
MMFMLREDGGVATKQHAPIDEQQQPLQLSSWDDEATDTALIMVTSVFETEALGVTCVL